jgi:4-hydroxy-tetrahydrodipicolinate synthase
MLKGCFPAIPTPMKYEGSPDLYPLDMEALGKLLDYVLPHVDGIVPVGTTGECATLTREEHLKVIKYVINYVHGNKLVIAGTGSNSTHEAIDYAKEARDFGANLHLSVVPYYNKPTQEGLFRHFGLIAEKVDLPMIVYNVPSRTARNLEPETVVRLAKEYSNIVGIKEANSDDNHIDKLFNLAQDLKDFCILSGNDEKTLYIMKKGGTGVISVAANVAPKETSELVNLSLKGNFDEAEKLDKELQPLFKVLFVEPNPIPVKAALKLVNIPVGPPRLPLVEAGESTKEELRFVLTKLGCL